jgi:hypothetical protein
MENQKLSKKVGCKFGIIKTFIIFVLKEDSDTYIYDVVNDDDAKEKFTVDLSEDDEDAVLPNNDEK